MLRGVRHQPVARLLHRRRAPLSLLQGRGPNVPVKPAALAAMISENLQEREEDVERVEVDADRKLDWRLPRLRRANAAKVDEREQREHAKHEPRDDGWVQKVRERTDQRYDDERDEQTESDSAEAAPI